LENCQWWGEPCFTGAAISIHGYLPQITDAEVILNHDNENVRNIGQGEGQHRKYKRLKLGGGQAYDRSSV
jgi:hypothetical protein